MDELTKVVDQIREELTDEDFFKDLELCLKGNKSAGLRCRKKTVDLTKLFKTFRKLSVNANKALKAEPAE